MDFDYFYSQICEELSGAKEYVKHALEVKPMNPRWGDLFLSMSATELEHAKSLKEMLDEYYAEQLKRNDEAMGKRITRYYEKIMDKYVNCVNEVKRMHEMY